MGQIGRARSRTLPALLACAVTLLVPAAAAAHPGHSPRHGHAHRQRPSRHVHRGHHRRAHAAVVNGTLTTISTVPWTVYITVSDGAENWACDGAIISTTQILTAAHCVYDDNGVLAPAADFSVKAGVSNTGGAGGQSATVTGIDANSGYMTGDSNPDPYDIAILTLASPLTTGPDVQVITLATTAPAPGSTVSVAGFGLQSYGELNPDGNLYSINQATYQLGECIDDYDAIIGCASAPGGATCNGDSGSAITQNGELVGILDEGGSTCQPGDPTLYAKTTTPEIADFIAGMPNPPVAPQGGHDISCQLPTALRPGSTITCTPGSTWTGSPTFGFEFVDDTTGAVLAQGSSSYTIGAGDVGRHIDFLASATNAGGTGWERTASIGPIQPALPPLQTIIPIVAPAPAPVAPKPATPAPRRPATTAVGPVTTTAHGAGGSRLRSTATVRSVRAGASFEIRAVVSAGRHALRRTRVCIAFAGPARVRSAARHGRRRGRSECWTVNVRAHGSMSLWLTLRVSSKVRRGSSLRLTTSAGRMRTHQRVAIR